MISDLIFKLDNVDTWDGPLIDSLWPTLIDLVDAAEGQYGESWRIDEAIAALKARFESL